MGGEKFTSCSEWDTVWGSPPRGRGKVPDVSVAEISEGITPAWAGKSSYGQHV